MGLKSFVKKTTKATLGITGTKALLSAGMKLAGKGGSGGGSGVPARKRYQRKKRDPYIAGTGYVSAKDRLAKKTAAKAKKSKKPKFSRLIGSGIRRRRRNRKK